MNSKISGSKVLVVEDDQAFAKMLIQEMEDQELAARWACSGEEAVSIMREWAPDLVVSHIRLPGMDGLELLRRSRGEGLDTGPDFLIITPFGDIARAVEALKAGAEDFLTKPLNVDHFMLTVTRILKNRCLRQEMNRIKVFLDQDVFRGMIGQSRAMRTLFDHIRRVAMADGPVLILGESGTGKELVARAIHEESKNHGGSFLAVNCAGIPQHLLESEFFGHKAGAFSGASKSRRGLCAEADGGTLFLDEVSEMPLFLQAKLLRMLQDGKIRPVGADKEEQVNVRTVAATHQDLEKEVKLGNFRQDLFFRLETFTLRVPPLRERGDDLEILAARLLQQLTFQTSKNIQGFDDKTLKILKRYPFPGNVRELKNAIERAVTFCDGKLILPEHLPARIRETSPAGIMDTESTCSSLMQRDERLPTLSEAEKHYIRHVLNKVGGNKRRAAAILGICRRTLYRKLE